MHSVLCTIRSLFSVLAAMNLPAAIEDLAGTSVPNSVLEKAARMREMGGHTMIHGLMNSLPELLTRNKEILDEVGICISLTYI